MTKNWAKIKMREKGETEYRHEQFVLQEYFKVYAPQLRIEMEYPVHSTDGLLLAKIDLADLTNKIAWRLDGDSHTNPDKDDRQKKALELRDWIVIDIKKDSWDWNWLWT